MNFIVKFKELYKLTDLPKLDNPADVSEILKGKQAISQDGGILTGTYDGVSRSEMDEAIQREADERQAQDSNLQRGIDQETAWRVEAQQQMQVQVNNATNRAGFISAVGTQLFVVTGVSSMSNNIIDLYLLMAHGGVFEVRKASLFFWGAEASNATISDGVSFVVPVEVVAETQGHAVSYLFRVHLERMQITNAAYSYTGVGRMIIRSM